jgi:hypothetical protein
MSLNRDKIMNTHKKARKDATTDQAQPHYEPSFEQIQMRGVRDLYPAGPTRWIRSRGLVSSRERAETSEHNRSRAIGQVERLRVIRGKHGNRNRQLRSGNF